jgi:hypothetical protein
MAAEQSRDLCWKIYLPYLQLAMCVVTCDHNNSITIVLCLDSSYALDIH